MKIPAGGVHAPPLRPTGCSGIYGACAEFDESRKGTLADVIALSQDLSLINPLEIHKTKVLLTVLGGRIVHREGL